MRCILLTLLCILSAQGFAQPQLQEIEEFGPNPGNLQMYIHTPKGQKDSSKKPLLVALHGCNQNANEIAQRTGWNKLADLHGFYILYPQQRFWNNPSSCFNWFKDEDTREEKGELASIRNMIDHMLGHYPIDSSRIHLYGMSAGGAMGTVLLATDPGRFQSGAIYAGSPYYGSMNAFKAFGGMADPPDRSPKEWGRIVQKANPGFKGSYPKLVAVHGKKDRVVDPENSRELVEQWTWLHGIDVVADSVSDGYRGAPEVKRSVHADERGTPLVIHYSIADIGHRLAIDPGDGPRQGGEKNLFAKDMDFHTTYWIGRDMGLVE